MKFNQKINVGNEVISKDSSTFIIAEAGVNSDGKGQKRIAFYLNTVIRYIHVVKAYAIDRSNEKYKRKYGAYKVLLNDLITTENNSK